MAPMLASKFYHGRCKMGYSWREVIRIIREWKLDPKQCRDALLLYRKVVLDNSASKSQSAINDLSNHEQFKKLETGTKH